MPKLDESGGHVIPELQLSAVTIVHDRARNLQVMRIQGAVVLPVGSEIELTDPNLTATVTGIRLLAGDSFTPVHVCLDVRVPGEYWDEEPKIARMR